MDILNIHITFSIFDTDTVKYMRDLGLHAPMHAARARHELQRRGRAEQQRQSMRELHVTAGRRLVRGSKDQKFRTQSLPEPKFADLEAIQIHGHAFLGLLTWADHTLIGMHAQPTSRAWAFDLWTFPFSTILLFISDMIGIHKSKTTATYIYISSFFSPSEQQKYRQLSLWPYTRMRAVSALLRSQVRSFV